MIPESNWIMKSLNIPTTRLNLHYRRGKNTVCLNGIYVVQQFSSAILSSCGLELHTPINNYITVRGTQMVKLDHEYDYKPVFLFKYESHRSWTSFEASHGTKKLLSVEMSMTLTVKVHNDRFDDDIILIFGLTMDASHKMEKAFSKLQALISSSALHNIQESGCTGFNQPTGTKSYLLSATTSTSKEELSAGFDKDIQDFCLQVKKISSQSTVH